MAVPVGAHEVSCRCSGASKPSGPTTRHPPVGDFTTCDETITNLARIRAPPESVNTMPDAVSTTTATAGVVRTIGRILLGVFLVSAGVGHLTVLRQAFQSQVPQWLPLDVDFVVVASGIVEILFGLAVLFLTRYRMIVGWALALFFLAIFPGNISQFFVHTNAEGWANPMAVVLGVRLLFQPLLVAWALWSTEAWKTRRGRH